MAVPAVPKIEWDTGFAKTITFFSAPDNPRPLTVPIGPVAESRSGVRDQWLTRTDYPLAIDARHIPAIADSGSINAYSTTDGWQDFLAWAMKQNQFRYYPNKDVASFYTCYLVGFDPEQHVAREQGGSRYRIYLPMRSSAKVTNY